MNNHIEFIFELVATKYIGRINLKLHKDKDKYWSFYVFNELVVKNIKIYDDNKYDSARDFLWDEVKMYYRSFVEWYNNNKYYHLIGFLLQLHEDQTTNIIEKIKNLSENNTKTDLEEELHKMIRTYFGGIDFEQFGYDDGVKAKNLLLLFNVITTMNSEYIRFPFDKFSEEKWSLEHIHAQCSEELKNKNQQRQLLNEQKQDMFICKNKDIISKIEQLLEMKEIDQVEFESLQKEISNLSSDVETTIHSIKNLALLTIPDNTFLSNSSFHKKRDKIKELDEKGSFIPICTKNVFLKYYSKDVEQNAKWCEKDMENYLIEIKKSLKQFIKENNNGYGRI